MSYCELENVYGRVPVLFTTQPFTTDKLVFLGSNKALFKKTNVTQRETVKYFLKLVFVIEISYEFQSHQLIQGFQDPYK